MTKTLIYALLLECLVVGTGAAVEKTIGISDHLMSSHAFGSPSGSTPQVAAIGLPIPSNDPK